jgi:hypothetical protein
MPQIPPMGDVYIDEIIKAIDPYDPSLNKTQGVKLRELIKLMRDRMDQQIAMSVTKQNSYTLVGDSNISVSPGTYFEQPRTFIVNRNSGLDAIISFEDYSAGPDNGKVYHIKNIGLKPTLIVSSANTPFDGESSITLTQNDSVVIMSATLTDTANAGPKWVIRSNTRFNYL